MNRTVTPPAHTPVRPGESPDVWDHLHRFLSQLSQTPEVDRQLRATLEVVRGATRADLVLLYSSASQQILESSGPDVLAVAELSRIARSLSSGAAAGDNHFLRHDVQLPGTSGAGSAALSRLSRSRGVWIVALREGAPPLDARDLAVIRLARRLLQRQQEQQQSQDELREMLLGLVRCLTAALDARDPYTWGHSERVARIAVRLAEQLRLPDGLRSELYLGGLLHDVGKIGVPDEILRKPGRLDPAEMARVREHPVIGDAIVGHVRQLAHVRPIVRNHHEQVDGRGYPDGLAGEDIPFLARIMAVADSCDAMMSTRPYREALPVEKLEAIMRNGAGVQWDAAVVEAFFTCRNDVYSIGQRGLGDSMLRAIEDVLRAGDPLAGAVRSFMALRPSANGVP